jgi:hypothetical protein
VTRELLIPFALGITLTTKNQKHRLYNTYCLLKIQLCCALYRAKRRGLIVGTQVDGPLLAIASLRLDGSQFEPLGVL